MKNILPSIGELTDSWKEDVGSFVQKSSIGQWSTIDCYGETTSCYTSTNAQRGILNNDSLGWRIVARLLQAHKIRIRIRLTTFHIKGCSYLIPSDKVGKIMRHTLYQRSLCTTCYNTNFHSTALYLLHEIEHTIEDLSFWHLMKIVCFHIIHPLRLFLTQFLSELFASIFTNSINPSSTFSCIRILQREVYSKLLHSTLPCNTMIRH